MPVGLYDTPRGRLLEVDPVEGGSCNDYGYVCGDPVNKVDLLGTCAKKVLGICVDNAISVNKSKAKIKNDALSRLQGCGGIGIGLCHNHVGTQVQKVTIKLDESASYNDGKLHIHTIELTATPSVYEAAPGFVIPGTPFGIPWNTANHYGQWTFDPKTRIDRWDVA
ncbi:MAG: repeat protein [Frankiales bacterium]|nr:repeat protein [Frankiales bacterium]